MIEKVNLASVDPATGIATASSKSDYAGYRLSQKATRIFG